MGTDVPFIKERTMFRVVIVTGGAQGIGACIAQYFAENGDKVVIADIKESVISHPNISFQKTDLKKEDDIKKLFSYVQEKYTTVHILINNGAISKYHKYITEVPLEEYDDVMAVNIRGAFVCVKEFIPLNKGQDYGRIVNISSTRWHQNEKDWEVYGISKGAMISLTNSLCVSLQDTPITVNAISPGWIETGDYDNLRVQDHKQHPSGRVGKPSDIARACLFLAAEENDFINGVNLIIDGGMTKKMIYE